jgi:hypothetical protein
MRVPPPLVLAVVLSAHLGASDDAGMVLEVDRTSFTLEARDAADGVVGPTLRVALGSPSHPTPTGEFEPRGVVRNPRYTPGAIARAYGRPSEPPSSDGPLGILKVPLGKGAILLHGGAHPLELGKPISLGCVLALDADLLALVDWLEARGALDPWQALDSGEVHGSFRRPVRVIVR